MKILDFLLKNPIFLFVILAWLVPTIGNILKKTEKARRARESAPPPPPRQSIPSQAQPLPRHEPVARREPSPVVQTAPRPTAASPVPSARSAEEVAREMRRILGLEPAPATPVTPPPVRRAPIAPPIERPPQPIQISTRDRKLELHVDPHVGDGIRGRHLDKSRRRSQRGGARLGDLGGRVVEHTQRSRAGSRFALDDLKRAFVLSEILAPPVALRPFEERRGH